MSRSFRWRLVVGIVLACALMALVFRNTDWPALGRAMSAADKVGLLGVVLATLVTYVLRAWRWGNLYAPLVKVPLVDLISATYVGFLSAIPIPRAGEIVRPYLISRRHPVSTSAGVATIVLERFVFDLPAVLLLFALYLFVLPTPAEEIAGPLMRMVKLGGAITGAASVVLLAALIFFHSRVDHALAVCERLLSIFPARVGALAAGILRAFGDGLAVFKAPLPHLLALVAQSFLVWLSIAASVWICLRAFGVLLPFHASFLVIAFLTVGVAIPTPANVGGLHYFFILAAEKVFGVENAVATGAAVAFHALTNLPVVVVGIYYFVREGLSLGRVAEMTETKHAGPVPATEGLKS